MESPASNVEQSLSGQYQTLLSKFSDLETIPKHRPDLKVKGSQKLAQEAIVLTGKLINQVESQQEDIKELWALSEKLGLWLEGQEGWNNETD